jgi:hypothetical protein
MYLILPENGFSYVTPETGEFKFEGEWTGETTPDDEYVIECDDGNERYLHYADLHKQNLNYDRR